MTKITAIFMVVGVAIVGLIVSCADNQGTRLPIPAIGRAPSEPESYLTAITDLPWRPYIQSAYQANIFQQAQLILSVQCMHRRGFTEFNKSMINYAEPDITQEPGGVYGWIDKDKARKYGFHPSPADATTVHAASGRLPAVENSVLGICLTHANSTLAGGKTIDPGQLVNQLGAEAWYLAANDARVRTATARWASCMNKRGFRYKSPPSQLQWVTKSKTASPVEISIASADASCTTSSDLAGFFFAVDAGYQRELIRQEATQLAVIGAAIKAENIRVSAVIKDSLSG